MRRKKIGTSKLKNPVKLVCTIVTVSFVIIQIISVIQLRSISDSPKRNPLTTNHLSESSKIGEFGETVIGMLPEDLAYPARPETEPERRQFLRGADAGAGVFVGAEMDFVGGFGAREAEGVRFHIGIQFVRGEQKAYDSISGFNLFVGKDLNGNVVVNGVVSEEVDLRIGETINYSACDGWSDHGC